VVLVRSAELSDRCGTVSLIEHLFQTPVRSVVDFVGPSV